MLNLNSIMIGSEDPKELAIFYEKVLEKKPDMDDGDWFGFSAGNCFLTIGPHDKVKGNNKNPEQIILNFETKEVETEFERIRGIGAMVIAKPYRMGEGDEGMGPIATFADPDGNFFQLMPPWES